MTTNAIVASCAFFSLVLGLLNWVFASAWPVFGTNPDLRRLNAERLLSVVHALLTTALSGYGLLLGWLGERPLGAHSMSPGGFYYDAPNSPALTLSLCLTQGYFIVDIVALWYNAVLEGKRNWPTLFTVHHIACMLYVAVCLQLGIGAQTAAVATLLGEVTNPLMNLWMISKDTPGLESVHEAISPGFTYFYITCRTILAPVWSIDVIYFCVGLPNSFGRIVGLVFSALCIGVNVGGLMWSKNLWRGYQKFLAKKKHCE